MLYQLSIRNIALIEKLTIEFGRGLNILSGETGAGKSIIVDSVNLVLGERADRELIKSGEEKAVVEGVFEIQGNSKVHQLIKNLGIDMDDELLIISRELSTGGKNICRINGRLVTLTVLKEISSHLVDLHGQHEHQTLLDEKTHIQFFDKFGGIKTVNLLMEVSEAYHKWKEIARELKERHGNEQERVRKIDMLRFQVSEINEAHLKADEEEELLRQRNILFNSEKIVKAVDGAYRAIYASDDRDSSILDSLRKIIGDFTDISSLDAVFSSLQGRLEEIFYNLEDIAFEIRDAKTQYDFSPELLDEIEERLDIINKLKRKYGSNIKTILDFREEASRELTDLENNIEIISGLEKKKAQAERQLYDASYKLSLHRRQTANQFEAKMMDQLGDLGMGKAQFKVLIEYPEDDSKCNRYPNLFTDNGFDDISFLIATNPGEPLKALNKIVSGGEMSRIMLAFRNIVAHIDDIPCLIFDEIDTGISGRIAQVVAEKMVRISDHHQIICVTHLPQIASMADHHYLIEKHSDERSAWTEVNELDREQRYAEIARMVGGTMAGTLSIDHARKMIEWADQFKENVS